MLVVTPRPGRCSASGYLGCERAIRCNPPLTIGKRRQAPLPPHVGKQYNYRDREGPCLLPPPSHASHRHLTRYYFCAFSHLVHVLLHTPHMYQARMDGTMGTDWPRRASRFMQPKHFAHGINSVPLRTVALPNDE